MNSRLNMIVFNFFWFGIVTFAGMGFQWLSASLAGIYVLIYFKFYLKNILAVFIVFVIGISFDLLTSTTGIIQFNPNSMMLPIWLMSLWVIFSQAAWQIETLFKSRLVILLFFGIGGPISYYYGTTVGLIKTNGFLIWPLQSLFWVLLGLLVLNFKPVEVNK